MEKEEELTGFDWAAIIAALIATTTTAATTTTEQLLASKPTIGILIENFTDSTLELVPEYGKTTHGSVKGTLPFSVPGLPSSQTVYKEFIDANEDATDGFPEDVESLNDSQAEIFEGWIRQSYAPTTENCVSCYGLGNNGKGINSVVPFKLGDTNPKYVILTMSAPAIGARRTYGVYVLSETSWNALKKSDYPTLKVFEEKMNKGARKNRTSTVAIKEYGKTTDRYVDYANSEGSLIVMNKQGLKISIVGGTTGTVRIEYDLSS